jgi:acyl-coenzyme A thioesterase PaaI-like protein
MNDSAEVNKFLTYATREEFPAPIGRLLGLTLIRDRVKRATVEFQAGKRYANPMGTLLGGVLCDITEAAMGVAYSSTLARGEAYTTMEL